MSPKRLGSPAFGETLTPLLAACPLLVVDGAHTLSQRGHDLCHDGRMSYLDDYLSRRNGGGIIYVPAVAETEDVAAHLAGLGYGLPPTAPAGRRRSASSHLA